MRVVVKHRLADPTVVAVKRKLDAISRAAGTKACREAMHEITRMILADARGRVPERTGQLRRALGRRVKVYRQSRVVVGIVGPRTGFKVVIDGKPVNPSKYAHLVEFGRAAVKVKAAKVLSSLNTAVSPDVPRVFGKAVGPAAPLPFLRPAADLAKSRAKWILLRHLSRMLKKVLSGAGLPAVA